MSDKLTPIDDEDLELEEGCSENPLGCFLIGILIVVITVAAIWGIFNWFDRKEQAAAQKEIATAYAIVKGVYAETEPSAEEQLAVKQLQRVMDGEYDIIPTGSGYVDFEPPTREGTKYTKPGLWVSVNAFESLTPVEFSAFLMGEMGEAADYYSKKQAESLDGSWGEVHPFVDAFLAKANRIPKYAKDIPDPYAQ